MVDMINPLIPPPQPLHYITQSLKNAFFSLRPGHSVSVVLNNDVAVIEIQEEGTINFEKVDTPLLIKF